MYHKSKLYVFTVIRSYVVNNAWKYIANIISLNIDESSSLLAHNGLLDASGRALNAKSGHCKKLSVGSYLKVNGLFDWDTYTLTRQTLSQMIDLLICLGLSQIGRCIQFFYCININGK